MSTKKCKVFGTFCKICFKNFFWVLVVKKFLKNVMLRQIFSMENALRS